MPSGSNAEYNDPCFDGGHYRIHPELPAYTAKGSRAIDRLRRVAKLTAIRTQALRTNKVWTKSITRDGAISGTPRALKSETNLVALLSNPANHPLRRPDTIST